MKKSSRLLIEESPLQVLPTLAVAIGLNEAIFLQQLQYWLFTSRHEVDGRKWVYNSGDEWGKQFPFWSAPTIRRIVTSLRDRGLILTRDDLNRSRFDHTLWYAIDYDALDDQLDMINVITSDDQGEQSIGSERSNGDAQSDQVFNNRLPETTAETTAENQSINQSRAEPDDLLIDSPSADDIKDSMAFLTAPEIGLNEASARKLAERFPFDEIVRQAFAWLDHRDDGGKYDTHGALIKRIEGHFSAPPLSSVHQATPLYRRFYVDGTYAVNLRTP